MSTTTTEPAVEIVDMGFVYPRSSWTLECESVVIPQGEVYGLTGPNGAGKSTLLKLIATLMFPTRGRLAMFGMEVRQSYRQLRRKLAYVPQENALAVDLTVTQNLELVGAIHGYDRSTARDRSTELIEVFELENCRNSLLATISGGQYRRASLAAAFMGDGELLLLDEPTAGLDLVGKMRFAKFVRELVEQTGITVVVSSHERVVLDRMTGNVLEVEDGRVRHGAVRSESESGFILEIGYMDPLGSEQQDAVRVVFPTAEFLDPSTVRLNGQRKSGLSELLGGAESIGAIHRVFVEREKNEHWRNA